MSTHDEPPGSHHRSEFEADLSALVNKHSLENSSGTPDFILATYIKQCLDAYNAAVCAREAWHGRDAYGLVHLQNIPADPFTTSTK